MRCKISNDSSDVRVTVSPRRSLWIMLVTPFCVLATTLHLLGAVASLHHAVWFTLLGGLLGGFYLWFFLSNLFERQEVDFHHGSIIATSNLLGWRRVRTYPVNEIRQISYAGFVPRGEPSLRLTLRDQELAIPVLTGLGDSEAKALLTRIAKSYPHLVTKISA